MRTHSFCRTRLRVANLPHGSVYHRVPMSVLCNAIIGHCNALKFERLLLDDGRRLAEPRSNSCTAAYVEHASGMKGSIQGLWVYPGEFRRRIALRRTRQDV